MLVEILLDRNVWRIMMTWNFLEILPDIWSSLDGTFAGPTSFFMVSVLGPTVILKTVQLRVNTLRPRQNGRHFADDTFKPIFLNENIWISIKISLKFVPKAPINNIPVLVQIMAWRRPGDKPLSEPMMVSFPTHICVTRPQWVKFADSSK